MRCCGGLQWLPRALPSGKGREGGREGRRQGGVGVAAVHTGGGVVAAAACAASMNFLPSCRERLAFGVDELVGGEGGRAGYALGADSVKEG